MPAIRCVVGLGNPGSKYKNTYHNLGFWAVDSLLSHYNPSVLNSDDGELYSFTDAPLEYAAKPGKYMNRSGEAVAGWAERLELELPDFLIIYDDLDLEVGKIRIRPSGSAGGHNGLQDIIDSLQSDRIPRLRIGIGPLPTNASGRDFVLSPINEKERKIYARIMENIPEVIEDISSGGLEEAMDNWNGVDFSE